METSSAFTAFSRTDRAEAQPLVQPGPYSRLVQATAGIRAWCRPRDANSEENDVQRQMSGWEAGGSSALSDGRLNVGTHLPWLGKRYQYLNLIGEGTSSQVVMAQDMLHPKQNVVAIKIMRRQLAYAGQKEARVLRWLSKTAPHAALVHVQALFMQAGHICLVMPCYPRSLLDLIVHSASWEPEPLVKQVRCLGAQLLATLADLHAHGLVHADLKPENILLSMSDLSSGVEAELADGLRLIDMGTSFSTTALNTAQISIEAQSLPYRAPEVALQLPCGPAMDVWSLGCILAELLLHQPLFPADSSGQLIQRVRETVGEEAEPTEAPEPAATAGQPGRLRPQQAPLEHWLERQQKLQLALARLDLQAADLIVKLLRIDPEQRLTAAQALSHPFFAPLLPSRHFAQAAGTAPKIKVESLGVLSAAQPSSPAVHTAAMPYSAEAVQNDGEPEAAVQSHASDQGMSSSRGDPTTSAPPLLEASPKRTHQNSRLASSSSQDDARGKPAAALSNRNARRRRHSTSETRFKPQIGKASTAAEFSKAPGTAERPLLQSSSLEPTRGEEAKQGADHPCSADEADEAGLGESLAGGRKKGTQHKSKQSYASLAAAGQPENTALQEARRLGQLEEHSATAARLIAELLDSPKPDTRKREGSGALSEQRTAKKRAVERVPQGQRAVRPLLEGSELTVPDLTLRAKAGRFQKPPENPARSPGDSEAELVKRTDVLERRDLSVWDKSSSGSGSESSAGESEGRGAAAEAVEPHSARRELRTNAIQSDARGDGLVTVSRAKEKRHRKILGGKNEVRLASETGLDRHQELKGVRSCDVAKRRGGGATSPLLQSVPSSGPRRLRDSRTKSAVKPWWVV